eukprot:1935519-Rhodomonas_salina.1
MLGLKAWGSILQTGPWSMLCTALVNALYCRGQRFGLPRSKQLYCRGQNTFVQIAISGDLRSAT